MSQIGESIQTSHFQHDSMAVVTTDSGRITLCFLPTELFLVQAFQSAEIAKQALLQASQICSWPDFFATIAKNEVPNSYQTVMQILYSAASGEDFKFNKEQIMLQHDKNKLLALLEKTE